MSEENAMLDSGQTEAAAAPPTESTAPPAAEPPAAPQQPESNATGGEKAQADTPPEPYALDFGVYGENVDAGEAAFLSKIAQDSGADVAAASKLVQDLTLYGQVKHKLQLEDWDKASYDDPEFGGDKYDESIAIATQGLAAYDPDGIMRQLLQETGYNRHPEVIRIFYRIGRDLAPDRMVSGGQNSGGDARAQFPNTPGLNP